ncbi:ABC transporter ATP-binding protein [bacterium]|nr:ABC transporter ATP-binding protein [bacterium]
MTLYSLQKITKVFNNRTILNIDFLEIEEGKIYALLGPNGAGKTTLLDILGFLEPLTTGNLLFRNSIVKYSENYLQKLRKNVVLVNQRPILFSTTVFKNLEFGLKIRGIAARQRRIIIDESLELVGLRHMIQAPAHKLSGGETQRVVLARAFALSPQVILCDEPTSSVDMENQIEIVNLLKTVNEEKNISIIMASHDKSQALSIAHHTLFIDRGSISDASYENLFSVNISENGDGTSSCAIHPNIKLVFSLNKNGKNRILFDPFEISLLDNNIPKDSPNILKGEVISISKEKDNLRLVINAGILLTVFLSREQYQNKRPLIGETVSIQIQQQAVRFL